ncbi:hypothetical protein CS0771_15710 [Catellatospora sp. IY07-71]|uniref:hypothetical protein n=1 Tax=Catellatospora sp. IY07-71 TaxID=2728827 RepID=UPI001BB458D7|nr:hypothetical protein [Catellatospora sp. IY07-71]BCJ72027.1 hypothetical protein CS0771_15710 [Catellatospora sp. IY07-71]
MMKTDVQSYLREKFAEHAGLPEDQLFGDDVTLATVIARSPRMTNSIDLMEAFARTANALRKEYGARVRLPAMPLDTPTTTVLRVFQEEFDRQREAVA